MIRRLLAHPGDQDHLLARFPHGMGDAVDLFRGLAGAVDDFTDALSKASMHVELRNIYVLDGSQAELHNGLVHGLFT